MSASGKTSRDFEALIGIRFADHDLLVEALTHSSFVNEYEGDEQPRDNERLEFLGDAVLDISSPICSSGVFPMSAKAS